MSTESKNNRETLYQAVAKYYRTAIKVGTIKNGEKLPSLRKIMRTHQVSLSTAVQACRELEEQGWLEARARSGYFACSKPHPRPLPSPGMGNAVKVNVTLCDEQGDEHPDIARMLALTQQTRPLVDLGAAVCSPSLYPAAELRAFAASILRSDPSVFVATASPRYDVEFKQALCRRMLLRGVQATADEIIVTNGCSEALTLALRAVGRPGDAVVVESPTYYGFLQLLESLGLKPVEVATNARTGLSVDAVDFALRCNDRIVAVLNMPSLHNPLGSSMPNDAKQKLVQLCARHDIALIEDDVYGELLPQQLGSRAQQSWDHSGHVIYCSSLNKTLSPGLRLGWMVAGKWRDAVRTMTQAESRPKEQLPQRVAARYLDSGNFERHLKKLRSRLDVQRASVCEAVLTHFPAGTTVAEQHGGMMLWVRLPPGVSSWHLFKRALRQGIRILPGAVFSHQRTFDAFIRLTCGWPLDEARSQAMARLGRLCTELSRGL